jgi:pimeloyl-ACP methyl ester carboxylesterase
MTHDSLQAFPCAWLVSEKTSRDIKRAPAVTACATAILLTMAFHDQSRAAEASVPGVPQAELVQWEVGLRQAGASPLEVQQFEELLQRQSAREYFESAPANFFASYLLGVRQEARERTPEPIFPHAAPVRSCRSLRDVSITNAIIEIVTVDPSDDSCRVTVGVSHPPAADHVKVFIGLPERGWNGRFRGTGGGGFGGGGESNLTGPIARGYAVGATDTGHEGSSGSFALSASGGLNWQEIRDYSYLGIHDMTVVGKTLTEAFYGRSPRHSYFVGGSTGGRQGLMEVQRYPEDYDGVLSACPAINWDRAIPAAFWAQVVMLRSRNVLPKAKLDAATAAAVASCDGLDGVMDGVIDDPGQCTFDPKSLVGTRVGHSTFTEADADVIRKVWEGPRGHDGQFLWYGVARGSSLSAVARTDGNPLTGRPFILSLEYLQYFLLRDRSWNWTALAPGEFERLFKQSVEEFRAVIGTDDPNLTRFRDHGGKVIIIHGLADQIIPAQGTVDYYKRMQQTMGGPVRTAQFARLFLVPGVDHGFVGAGPTPTGLTDAIIRWVEDREPPARIIGELPGRGGTTVRTRILCTYPKIAKCVG